jgi:phosphoglycerate kinase
MKKTIDDIDVRGKRVFVRLDLDVPIDENGSITDDRRLRAAIPTVRKLIEEGGRIVLMGHLGRPSGDAASRAIYTLFPVANRLSELLKRDVRLVPDCIGSQVTQAVQALRDGEVCLLENLRFHKAEQIKDKDAEADPALRKQKDEFARHFASLAEVFVNDAFGTSHRDNASVLTVPKWMEKKPRVIGYHLKKELEFLSKAFREPSRPFVCLLGGAKVSDKLGVIRALVERCDTLLVGGAMAYTFLAAGGVKVGKSRVEPERYEEANEIRAKAGDKLWLPVDSVGATAIEEGVETMELSGDFPDEVMGLDIGPKTIEVFGKAIAEAKMIFWNGPMGVFETPPFDQGTLAMAKAVAAATKAGATSIIGGGDSAAAIDKAGLADAMTHVSTGGGASLEILEGKRFATIDALDNWDKKSSSDRDRAGNGSMG